MTRNTLDKKEYVTEHLVWMIIGYIFYNNALLRPIGSLTTMQSRIVLIVALLFCVGAGILLDLRRFRNSISTFCHISVPLGLYTLIGYWKIRQTVLIIVLSIFVCAAFAILIWRTIHRKNVAYSIRQSVFVLCCGFAAVVVACSLTKIVTNHVAISTVTPKVSHGEPAMTIENQIQVLERLRQDQWEELSIDERLNVLQIVANVEGCALGLPEPVMVCADNLKDNILGEYNFETREIRVNMTHLEEDSSYEVVDTVCHELRHSWQACVVKVYENTEPELRDLKFWGEAWFFQKELANYTNSRNFDEYSCQHIEDDAVEYAKEATEFLFKMIEYYSAGGSYLAFTDFLISQ